MSKQLYCLKIGGSVISDKTVPYKAKKAVIRAIARSIKECNLPMIIAHGSGSFGHTSATIYGGKNGYTDTWGIAKVSRDAQEINRIVMDIFVEEKLPAISFSPRSFILTERAKPQKYFFDPIDESLKQGLLPIVYGDVIWDTSQKTTILSGETILNLFCKQASPKKYSISKIIELCNVAGVLDGKKNVIPEINKKNWEEVKQYLKALAVADVTGGMEHKIEDALEMTAYGIETWIVEGNNETNIKELLEGTGMKGTIIR